jgi:acetyl esterase/lipase
MKQLSLFIILGVILGSVPSQAEPGPIVLRVEGMDAVQVTPDLVYRTVDGVELQFDIYVPPGQAPSAGWPVAVLFHGGPIGSEVRPKDWPLYQSYGRLLAASGVAAAIPNYRLMSPIAWQPATEDAVHLLKYLRTNSSDLKINADAMALWAFSGGGPQLGLASQGQLPYVRCLVSFYAFLDTLPPAAEYSPLRRLREQAGRLPPMFIARMGKDIPELNLGVDAFVQEARAAGHAVQVAEYADGVHAFDVEQDTDESRKVIAEAVAFVKDQLAEEGGADR